MLKFRNDAKISLREKLIILCPAVVLVIFAFVVVYYFVDPLPPRRISIGCGSKDSANYINAKSYQKILSKEGITLDFINTAGSVENLKLLGAEPRAVEDQMTVKVGLSFFNFTTT